MADVVRRQVSEAVKFTSQIPDPSPGWVDNNTASIILVNKDCPGCGGKSGVTCEFGTVLTVC